MLFGITKAVLAKTITFHLASRLAEQRPNTNVLVIDLCPQANSSMMLLGGGMLGESNALSLCTKATPKTVVGYLGRVISGGARATLPNPDDFIVKASSFNRNLTENLYLLCGDGNLEPMAPAISGAAAAPALTPDSHPWKWVHLVFRKLIEQLAASASEDWIVLIDTNPSFSIYTELAVSAADKLITPVNADDSSRVATNAMFILLHGQVPPHPIYGSWTFATKAKEHGLQVPQIHVVVGNRLTQYVGAARAFAALSDATADSLFAAYKKSPTFFTPRKTKSRTIEEFREQYSVPLRDFNTAGVVSAHKGARLSQMEQGYYNVFGQDVKVNADRIEECLDALDEVAAFI